MDDINQIIANLTPQDMEMLRGVAASILGDGVQRSAPVSYTHLRAHET